MRAHGRELHEARPLEVDSRTKLKGSATTVIATAGDTRVHVSVRGPCPKPNRARMTVSGCALTSAPGESRGKLSCRAGAWASGPCNYSAGSLRPRRESAEQAATEVHLHVSIPRFAVSAERWERETTKSSSRSGGSCERELSARRLHGRLSELLVATLCLEEFQKQALDLVVVVLRDDGGVVSVATNGVIAALVQARWSMRTLVAASSAIAFRQPQGTGWRFLVDPTSEEEEGVMGKRSSILDLVLNCDSKISGLNIQGEFIEGEDGDTILALVEQSCLDNLGHLRKTFEAAIDLDDGFTDDEVEEEELPTKSPATAIYDILKGRAAREAQEPAESPPVPE